MNCPSPIWCEDALSIEIFESYSVCVARRALVDTRLKLLIQDGKRMRVFSSDILSDVADGGWTAGLAGLAGLAGPTDRHKS